MKRFLLFCFSMFILGAICNSNLLSQSEDCPPSSATFGYNYGDLEWERDTVWIDEVVFGGDTCRWRFIYCHRSYPTAPIT